MILNDLEVTGRQRSHIIQLESPRFAAQPDVAEAFMRMRSAAAKDGISIHPVSSFRDYGMQTRIWNRKFSGKSALYDEEGRERNFATLKSSAEIIACILNWSAIPGGSRHHWGTEIDVVDFAAMPPGYSPLLLPSEIQPNGLFRPLHRWLDENMATFNFFRPYNYFLGGMYPEPWHLSYAPASVPALKALSLELLLEITRDSQLLGKETAVKMLPEIFLKHVLQIVHPEQQEAVTLGVDSQPTSQELPFKT